MIQNIFLERTIIQKKTDVKPLLRRIVSVRTKKKNSYICINLIGGSNYRPLISFAVRVIQLTHRDMQ